MISYLLITLLTTSNNLFTHGYNIQRTCCVAYSTKTPTILQYSKKSNDYENIDRNLSSHSGHSGAFSSTRRNVIFQSILSTSSFLSILITSPVESIASSSSSLSSLSSSTNPDVIQIKEASEVLDTLLSNWDKATIDCTYADVPRELLETKNKEQLLEKASTFALFDKSTSVTSCKKTNKVVRDYIGVTGKGPMVNVDKKMLKRNVVDLVDVDSIDEYFSEVEAFSQAISKASSFSYAAGIADFDSVNNFSKDDKTKLNNDNSSDTSDGTIEVEDNSNLGQTKKAIIEAKKSIDRIVEILVVSSSTMD